MLFNTGILLAVSLLLELCVTRVESEECITNDGPGKGKPCVFPFTFIGTGKTYKECTSDRGQEYWCSTKVNGTGVHEGGQWGACVKGCPGVPDSYDGGKLHSSCKTKDDQDCQFPFSIEGMTYYGCISDSGKRVCPVKNANGKFSKTECSEACPKDELLTNEDLAVEDILETLLKKPVVYTTIERGEGLGDDGPKCPEILEEKFKKVDESKLNELFKGTKTWEEAYKKACENTEYCKTGTTGDCGSTLNTKRFNILKAEDGAEHTPNADCMIKCASPED